LNISKITIIKAAGLVLLVAAAVYTQYRPQGETNKIEVQREAVPEASALPQESPVLKVAMQAVAAVEPPPEVVDLPVNYEPLDLVRELIAAPYGKEPGEIYQNGSWRLVRAQPEYGSEPDYSKRFVKKGKGAGVTLYSYAEPSLTGAVEHIMAGEAEIPLSSGREQVVELLKKNAFDVPETPGQINFKKGELNGRIYLKDSQRGDLLVVRLEHRDISKYRRDNRDYAVWMPLPAAKLAEDIEKAAGPEPAGADWGEGKKLLAGGSSMPLEKLIAATSAIAEKEPEGEAAAPFMGIQKYLVDAMMRSLSVPLYKKSVEGDETELAAGLKMLDDYGVEYDLQYMGESYAAKNNELLPVYEAYPTSYWGEFAFVREMEGGFDNSNCGLFSPAVITEGGKFLAGHPGSPFLTRVLFLLGKANETAYTVWLSPGVYSFVCSDSACVKPEEEIDGYRLAAIKYYAALLGRPDGKSYERHLEKILPILRTKGNTYGSRYAGCSPM
jgi:hypothetical protein